MIESKNIIFLAIFGLILVVLSSSIEKMTNTTQTQNKQKENLILKKILNKKKLNKNDVTNLNILNRSITRAIKHKSKCPKHICDCKSETDRLKEILDNQRRKEIQGIIESKDYELETERNNMNEKINEYQDEIKKLTDRVNDNHTSLI